MRFLFIGYIFVMAVMSLATLVVDRSQVATLEAEAKAEQERVEQEAKEAHQRRLREQQEVQQQEELLRREREKQEAEARQEQYKQKAEAERERERQKKAGAERKLLRQEQRRQAREKRVLDRQRARQTRRARLEYVVPPGWKLADGNCFSRMEYVAEIEGNICKLTTDEDNINGQAGRWMDCQGTDFWRERQRCPQGDQVFVPF